MSRSTCVDDYNKVWLDFTKFNPATEKAVETCLEDGRLIHTQPPRYAGVYDNVTYTLLNVSNPTPAIVSAFGLNSLPRFTYRGLERPEHMVNRMSQRGVSTGPLKQLCKDYVIQERKQHGAYTIIGYIDGAEYYAIVNTETREIETVWKQ